MNSNNPPPVSHHESWASAFVDGETTLISQANWTEAVQEQLYYYTLTRQVLRGDAIGPRGVCWQERKTSWVRLWTRVDAR